MKTFYKNLKKLWLAALIFSFARATSVFANPTGLTVSSGSATAQQTGAQLNITVSQLAILNWSSFNIAAGETTSFLQPSSSSVVFNVIGGASPSQILGNLNANGTVILENASGFYFGSGSMINVGGSFLATTAPLTPDFGSGAGWQFTGMPPLASIVNYGQIQVGGGKSLFLIAEKIENDGALDAPGGDVELAAGQSVLVSDSPDGRGLSAAVTLPQGSVDNFGRITADGGSIVMQAQVVNQNGLLQADSIAEKNGVIELVASDTLNLGANSQILAHGDATAGGSAGGTVTLQSGNVFSDTTGSQIVTTGGAHGGNGGNIEVSAPNIESLNSSMDAGAQSGFVGGEFLLDPVNIILGTSGTGTVSANGTVGTVGYSDSSGDTLSLNVNTAFANKNFSTILLQATGNIYVGNGSVSGGLFTFAANPGITWNLSSSTGETSGQLTMEAGGDIYFGTRSLITDANNWSVTLEAGYNFNTQSVQAGNGPVYSGSIYLGDVTRDSSGNQSTDANGNYLPSNGSGSIQLASGNVELTAGGAVAVGTGSVLTTAGGNIDVEALAGDIIVGTKTSGVDNSGYGDDNFGNWNVSSTLGGISTMAGGNVTLDAVLGNINPSTRTTIFGVSGAFGSEPGNVTLIAGDQIFGTFNVADGTGTILAGVSLAGGTPTIQNSGASVGSSTQPVSLQLAAGSWNVWAGDDIYIGEVRNPSGTFDDNDSFPFNYSPDAAANFWAGNGITLQGQNQPRTPDNSTMESIYAPQLSLTAGAGGITINNPIILFPSSAGALHLTTTDGGNVTAVNYDDSNPLPPSITMSDSGDPGDWTTFASGQAATPLHLGNPNPVTLDIAGNIYGLILNVPTFADITVGGSTYNFGFSGENLSPSQTTSINVAGDIIYSTTLHAAGIALADALPAELFSATLSGDSKVAGDLSYGDGTLTFNGQMTVSDLTFLLNPTVVELNAAGQPVLDSSGNPVLVPVALDVVQQAAVLALYVDSQTANGLALSGFGNFDITAHNIELGISDGITVDFPNAPDAALTAISPYGANLNVTASGNLDLTATKIANGSLSGATPSGGITLNVGGVLDVGGSATTLGDPDAPKGIFTTSGGDITINAVGDVNVDGSRIAAYDGGNINVTSQNGDINAGDGGEGFVIFQALELNAAGQLIGIPTDIPLSGILATTVFGSAAELGNITLDAPNGNINSSLGGVLQIAFNTANTANNFIDVTAGKDINATGSGIIGYNVKLQAGGNINGVVVGSDSVAVSSQQSVDVTAVSGGNVDISASGNVSGTIIGGGDVSVSGSSIDAAVRGGSVSTSGDTSGASLGAPAAGPQENAPVADNADAATSKTDSDDNDLLKKKKGVALAQKVSRVTVLLPGKN
jgi:filamentous hemagglutinin family protein